MGTVPVMRVLGVDLAAQAVSTGAVLLERADNWVWAATVIEEADDDSLVEAGSHADAIGLDCPLGWPTAFVEAVSAHHRLDDWPGSSDRRPLTHRLTDHELRRRKEGTPMSVSADLLGHVAMRGALLQHEWSAARLEPGVRDGSTWLMEVYPAASLKAWGLPSRGYKFRRGDRAGQSLEVRREIVDGLSSAVGPHLALGEAADRCLSSDHVLDGLICALTVLVVRAGGTTRPTEEQRPTARTEGWIHVPMGPLDASTLALRRT